LNKYNKGNNKSVWYKALSSSAIETSHPETTGELGSLIISTIKHELHELQQTKANNTNQS
jgi:hypothetical protein